MNHLNKVKSKLEQTLDELEDTLEREKKARADLDKNKRKVESDLKLAQEAVADLEKGKKDLESALSKKEKEISSLNTKLEEEQAQLARTQKQIKESQVSLHILCTCPFLSPASDRRSRPPCQSMVSHQSSPSLCYSASQLKLVKATGSTASHTRALRGPKKGSRPPR